MMQFLTLTPCPYVRSVCSFKKNHKSGLLIFRMAVIRNAPVLMDEPANRLTRESVN